jgi:hypothetical protein
MKKRERTNLVVKVIGFVISPLFFAWFLLVVQLALVEFALRQKGKTTVSH